MVIVLAGLAESQWRLIINLQRHVRPEPPVGVFS